MIRHKKNMKTFNTSFGMAYFYCKFNHLEADILVSCLFYSAHIYLCRRQLHLRLESRIEKMRKILCTYLNCYNIWDLTRDIRLTRARRMKKFYFQKINDMLGVGLLEC